MCVVVRSQWPPFSTGAQICLLLWHSSISWVSLFFQFILDPQKLPIPKWKLYNFAPCFLTLQCHGLFTVSIFSDCDIANKWVPLISMVLFTSKDVKHQRKNREYKYNYALWMGPQVNLTRLHKYCGICLKWSFTISLSTGHKFQVILKFYAGHWFFTHIAF